MEFTNQSIDISTLPKFEETALQPLEKNYFKVMLIQFGIFYTLVLIAILILFFLEADVFFKNNISYLVLAWLVLSIITFLYLKISFAKKGFALREHDVIFKSGVVSETTTIVTNNRVQHVALHQGLLSRFFGLASIELFTAGGSTSDLKIKGLLLDDAKKIKESVSLKIIEITTEILEQEENTMQDEVQTSDKANLNDESDAN